MNKTTSQSRTLLTLVASGLALGLLGYPALGQQASTTVTVYKSPACGCCRSWVEHMRQAGFAMKVQDVDDIEAVKKTYGVPLELAACHTSLVGGYVVEGHVPADAVARLVRERPKIAGIAVAGMPIGSPGMEQGNVKQPYNVVAFDKRGAKTIFDTRR
jgi:hypothetical protein